MQPTQKAGGVAALVAAGTFVFGLALFVTAMSDYATGDPTAAESAAFVAEHETTLFVWQLVILIVFGLALVPLVVALHERLSAPAPTLSRIATPLGFVWVGLVIAAGMIANIGQSTVADLYATDPAQAATVWLAFDLVQNGLGGGNELAGGVWVALVSVAALRTRALPRGVAVLGVLTGASGIVTFLPALEEVGAVFGLGMIAWFVWVGVVLLRTAPPAVAVGRSGVPADAASVTADGIPAER